MESVLEEVVSEMESAVSPEAGALAALDATLRAFGCATGTIHRLDPEAPLLHLLAQRGMPDALLDRVRVIPVGKGMAGLAAERLEPVQVCNLQTDESGQAKPAAKMTGMEGSIAFPMIVGGRLVGAMGIAKPTAYDFTPEEAATLMKIGAEIGGRLE